MLVRFNLLHFSLTYCVFQANARLSAGVNWPRKLKTELAGSSSEQQSTGHAPAEPFTLTHSRLIGQAW